MRYPKPAPHTDGWPYLEYDGAPVSIIRPLEEEIWSSIRLMAVKDICVGQLKARKSPMGRRGRLVHIASKINSCIAQAEEFFKLAADASARAAPLLHYYSMLNLAKALIYIAAPQRLARKQDLLHGLSDTNRVKDSGTYALANESVSSKAGVFSSLHWVLTGSEAPKLEFNVVELLRYCVWIANEMEELGEECRFVDASIQVKRDSNAKALRISAELDKDEITRVCADISSFESQVPGFSGLFKRVTSDSGEVRYETAAVPYSSGASWRTALHKLRSRMSGVTLYRLMMQTPDQTSTDYSIPLSHNGIQPLPEPCVLLAITFYFGSLVRYQPHIYDHLLGSQEAWLLESFIRQCPLVFAYLILNHMWREEHLFGRP